ncbi:unnamed protein product, partial [Meganyctiphanes norvegica]
MSFTDNLTIYFVLIVTISILLLFLIWARRKDVEDRKEVGAFPMSDNFPEDKYFYEIMVFTGSKTESQTDSLVQFILSGDAEETEVRTFTDISRKIFRKSEVNTFLMSVPRSLGNLQFLRIWHDNSGQGPNASWYLSNIVFRDVQTYKKFQFVCNQWLAIDSDDGLIDRLLPVSGQEQLTEFKHLFDTTVSKNLTDDHLWFSIFLRPPRSRFTRCDEEVLALPLLGRYMLANCLVAVTWLEVV